MAQPGALETIPSQALEYVAREFLRRPEATELLVEHAERVLQHIADAAADPLFPALDGVTLEKLGSRLWRVNYQRNEAAREARRNATRLEQEERERAAAAARDAAAIPAAMPPRSSGRDWSGVAKNILPVLRGEGFLRVELPDHRALASLKVYLKRNYTSLRARPDPDSRGTRAVVYKPA